MASGDGYNLGAGQPYDDSDAVLELSPSMQLESKFYLSDWQTLSAEDLDLGTGDPALVDGFVFQIGKTDTAYLLRQGHLGGEDGEVASLSMCSGDPNGGHAVKGSVVYVPCPNGVTAVKVSAKPPVSDEALDRQRRRGRRTDHRRRAGLGDRQQRGARPQPGQWRRSRLDFLRWVCESLPDAVGRRWSVAPSRNGPGLRLHGSGRAAAAALRAVATTRLAAPVTGGFEPHRRRKRAVL